MAAVAFLSWFRFLLLLLELMSLSPLPVTALNDPDLESLYPFSHFNPIQTQVTYALVL